MGNEHAPLCERRWVGVLGQTRWALVLLALSALTGCKHYNGITTAVIADPLARHPIVVSDQAEQLDIEAPAGTVSLAPQQRSDVYHFVADFKSGGNGRLLVSAPSGSKNEIAAMNMLGEIRAIIRRSGVHPQAVDYHPYRAGGRRNAPIQITYRRYHAQGPDCGDWSTNLADDPQNLPYPNLGCATQHNLAAVVANPRDFLEPRGMTPRSSERRDVVWDKYIKGEPTGAQKSEEEKTTVSEVEE